MRVIGNASVAAAAQLSAVRPTRRPGPGCRPGAAAGPRARRRDAPAAPGAVATPAGTAAPAAPAPATPPRSLDELLAELDALIGLQRVKREIHRQVALLRVEKLRVDAGLKSPTMTRHLVFTGNPGTGKTTVARLVGGIYQALGLLSRGHLVEVDRSELVAGYLGQTATKTAEVVASAAGGVLFIDEAYSLTGSGPGGDQYGQESVDTLVKEMEDRRDDLVVIVAGYPAPMAAFIAANPGLASRFRTTIEFEDYTDDELVAILRAPRRRAPTTSWSPRPSSGSARCSAAPRGTARSATAGSPATPSRRPSATTPGGCARRPAPPSSSSASSWPATSTRNRSTREPRWPPPRPTVTPHLRTRTPGTRP